MKYSHIEFIPATTCKIQDHGGDKVGFVSQTSCTFLNERLGEGWDLIKFLTYSSEVETSMLVVAIVGKPLA